MLCAVCRKPAFGDAIGYAEVCPACYEKYQGAADTQKQNLMLRVHASQVNAQNVAMDEALEKDTRVIELRGRVRNLEKKVQQLEAELRDRPKPASSPSPSPEPR